MVWGLSDPSLLSDRGHQGVTVTPPWGLWKVVLIGLFCWKGISLTLIGSILRYFLVIKSCSSIPKDLPTLVSVMIYTYYSVWSWYVQKFKKKFTKMYYKCDECDKCQPKWYNKQLFLCLSGLICTLQSICCQIRWSYFSTTPQIGMNVSLIFTKKSVTAINIFADVRFLHMTDFIYNSTSIIFIVSHD